MAVGTTPTQIRKSVLSSAASRIASERDAAARSFVEKAHVLRVESIDKLDERRRGLITEREQLLNDRVMAGAGMLIVEEAPLAARRDGVRRGLEGMIDAGMKVFGM